MVKQLQSVTWDKWMGSDVDTVTLFFEESSGNGFVDEFDVSENENHMVLYKTNPENGEWIWVMIVNPMDVLNHQNAAMPDIVVTIDDNSYTLRETVQLLVSKKSND